MASILCAFKCNRRVIILNIQALFDSHYNKKLLQNTQNCSIFLIMIRIFGVFMDKHSINTNNDLAEVLKLRRHQLKITQKSLASFCNLSHNGISRIELGQSDVQLSTILKMSKILGFKIILEMES